MSIEQTIKKLNMKRSADDLALEKGRKTVGEKTVKDLESKHNADLARKINWKPLFSRVKIERAPETLSGIIQLPSVTAFVRGKIVEVGPDVGKRDGKMVHPLKPGQFIIYQKAHEIIYTDIHGKEHIFLKENADVQSIIAVEESDTLSPAAIAAGTAFEAGLASSQLEHAYNEAKKAE